LPEAKEYRGFNIMPKVN